MRTCYNTTVLSVPMHHGRMCQTYRFCIPERTGGSDCDTVFNDRSHKLSADDGECMPNIPKEQLDPELLLVLYAVDKAPDGIPTKTHYQKMMYLILKAMGNDPRSGAGYVPHHFGPYSPVVEGWRDVLIGSGYLVKNTHERIRVSPEAREDAGCITFDDPVLELKIRSIVEFVCSLTYEELILFIYTDDILKKEGMTINSDVKDDIFSRRVPISLRMAKAGKVSVAKGAELADMDVASFEGLLGKGSVS